MVSTKALSLFACIYCFMLWQAHFLHDFFNSFHPNDLWSSSSSIDIPTIPTLYMPCTCILWQMSHMRILSICNSILPPKVKLSFRYQAGVQYFRLAVELSKNDQRLHRYKIKVTYFLLIKFLSFKKIPLIESLILYR